MLEWEQLWEGQKLHAYDGHGASPVCGAEVSRRADDAFPRTTYHGPMPPPPELICDSCKTYEREHDPMYLEGIRFERARIVAALRHEANRIYRQQEKDYPSNVLDVVALNLAKGGREQLSVREDR
jgi:hypothetical protein